MFRRSINYYAQLKARTCTLLIGSLARRKSMAVTDSEFAGKDFHLRMTLGNLQTTYLILFVARINRKFFASHFIFQVLQEWKSKKRIHGTTEHCIIDHTKRSGSSKYRLRWQGFGPKVAVFICAKFYPADARIAGRHMGARREHFQRCK